MVERHNTIAVVGGGGREHALVQQYSHNPDIQQIFAFPGNDLMRKTSNVDVLTHPGIKTTDVQKIVSICRKQGVTHVDVAQDDAVAAGLVNALSEVGISVLGPTKEAGKIEWDKMWSREFMARHHILQPKFMGFNSAEEGIHYLHNHQDQPWFVKASGLAGGKGALPAENNTEAVARIIELQQFGRAGETFLLEEWIKGENGDLAAEFSAFAICDGESFKILGYAKDFKRANDGDTGENTGGMGCLTPPSEVNSEIKYQTEKIFDATISGLRRENHPYKGILYLGGMIGEGGKVYVVEFNARWGDPEAQILVPGLQTDLMEIAQAVEYGEIASLNLRTDGKHRVIVAGTANGYPQNYDRAKGKSIYGLEKVWAMPYISLFGGGIKQVGSDWVVNGGRVFYIVGEGQSVEEARNRAYQAIDQVEIEGDNLHFRTDIGLKEISRIRQSLVASEQI